MKFVASQLFWFLCFLAGWFLLLVGCDEESAKTTSPVTATAASSEVPTPEKVAGVEFGTVRLCVVPKGGASPGELPVKVSPVFVEGEPPVHEKVFSLKKGDKGYCEFVHPDFSLFWGNRLVVSSEQKLDEVGVYYLKDFKENPGADALTYAKAVATTRGTFELGVVLASSTVPVIQVQVKE